VCQPFTHSLYQRFNCRKSAAVLGAKQTGGRGDLTICPVLRKVLATIMLPREVRQAPTWSFPIWFYF
jgi:hypothetical protein